CQHGYGVPWTL
nr:immunoglobulin light chain junction region [Macaca mulatta]